MLFVWQGKVFGLGEIGRPKSYFPSKAAAFVLQPVHLVVASPPYEWAFHPKRPGFVLQGKVRIGKFEAGEKGDLCGFPILIFFHFDFFGRVAKRNKRWILREFQQTASHCAQQKARSRAIKDEFLDFWEK